MKKTVYSCDICGKQDTYIPDGWYVFKVKKKWISFYESGWNKEKACICDDCIKVIRSLVNNNRPKDSIDIFDRNKSVSEVAREVVDNSKKKPIGCKECPHAPKKFEEFCNWDWRVRHGDSHDYDWLIDHNYCIDAFSEQAKYCNNYNKEYPDE